MIPAPTNEIAIGRKISDLAMFSPLRPVGEHGDGQADRRRQPGDDHDPPDVVEDRAPHRGEDGDGEEEEPDAERRHRRPAALERLAGLAPAVEATEHPEREEHDGDDRDPAGEDVGPVVEVDRVVVGEDRGVVVPADGLLAAVVEERQVDGADQRGDQPDGDERQRRGHEDPHPGLLLDPPALGQRRASSPARCAGRSGRPARAWPAGRPAGCRARCCRHPRRRRASPRRPR